ncbi:ABC transporter ATP-binding protein [Paenibacillus filicis]|uniref:ABC transporter ATP-binding protein n=1 Tax=Paenibacillus gyeongsangnamensis TaxID=3388067 RepID=A0ABT4QAX1_9BACL|nr:ABC transporter ATP-binding protein [Paenibacillus filicis]MCZ8514029.1 ABC transporter ATP-binding protein [Paenibacillus filicis]
MKAAIALNRVSKEFKGKRAVDDLTLDIAEGSVVALLGPNGAGKTTSVTMMLGLQKPTSGTVRLLSGDPGDRSIRARIGAMLQEVNVIDRLKVREIIDLFRSYYDKPMPLERLLKISGLDAEKEKMATSLSGGQKRRLDFALALAGDPSVLFLDEPTVGMDITSRLLFWDTVRALAGSGRTIILTTHYLDEADSIADRVVVINRGRLAADGTPEKIKSAAGGRILTFTAGASFPRELIDSLPGVTQASWSGRRVRLHSADTDRLLFELVGRQADMKDIEVHGGGLEEAFQHLVQDESAAAEEARGNSR